MVFFLTQMDFKQKKKKTDEDTDEKLDTTIMPELESEEYAAERRNQPGKCIKILTPNQMVSRLPISQLNQKQEIILTKLKMK